MVQTFDVEFLFLLCLLSAFLQVFSAKSELPLKETLNSYMFDYTQKWWFSYVKGFVSGILTEKLPCTRKEHYPSRQVIETLRRYRIVCACSWNNFLKVEVSKNYITSHRDPNVVYGPSIFFVKVIHDVRTYSLVKRPFGRGSKSDVAREYVWGKKPLSFSTVHRWAFNLHHLLRLNITFHQILFIFSDVSSCFIGNITISRFIYCGHHSQFVTYPPYKEPRILLTVNINIVTYNVSFSFVVFDHNRVTTSSKGFEQVMVLWTWVLTRGVCKKSSYSRYLVVGHKTECVSMRLVHSVRDVVLTMLFDGPGDQSCVLKQVEHSNVTHTEKLYSASTFQCVVDVLGSGQSACIKYMFKSLVFPKMYVAEKGTLYSFSNEEQCHMSNICGLHINTHPDSFVKVSISKVKHSENCDPFCKYAGLSAYHPPNEHLSTICDFSKDFDEYKPVYSTSASLILIFYCYKEYSSLTFAVTVSAVKCQPITYNICNYFENRKFLTGNVQVEKRRTTQVSLRVSVLNQTCTVVQLVQSMTSLLGQHFHFLYCDLDVFSHAEVVGTGFEMEYHATALFTGKSTQVCWHCSAF